MRTCIHVCLRVIIRLNRKLLDINNTLGGLEVGDVITYTYPRVNKLGMPVSPEILRKRSDVDWDGLCRRCVVLYCGVLRVACCVLRVA